MNKVIPKETITDDVNRPYPQSKNDPRTKLLSISTDNPSQTSSY